MSLQLTFSGAGVQILSSQGNPLTGVSVCIVALEEGDISVTATADDGGWAEDGTRTETCKIKVGCDGEIFAPTDLCPDEKGLAQLISCICDPGDPNCPNSTTPDWSIEVRSGNPTVRLKSVGDTCKRRIVVDPESESGEVFVVAKWGDCEIKHPLTIGCGAQGGCAGGSCGTGATDVRPDGIDVRIPLGPGLDDQDAGTLSFHIDVLKPASGVGPFVINNLRFSGGGSGVVIYDPNDPNRLRQIKTPLLLAALVDTDPNDGLFDVRFFEPNEVTNFGNTAGPWDDSGSPMTEWDFDGSTANTLTLSRSDDGALTRQWRYTFSLEDANDPNVGWTWQLETGATLASIERTTTTKWDREPNATWIRTTTVTQDGDLYAKTIDTWKAFTFGRRLIAREALTGDGAASLETTWTYVLSGSAIGRVRSIEQADGSWVYYEYDAKGRKAAEYTPWKNGAIGAPPGASASSKVTYGYAPHDPNDAGDPNDPNETRPRTISTYATGTLVSKTYYAYTGSVSAPKVITETGLAAYGSSTNLRSEVWYLDEAQEDVDQSHSSDGRLVRYSYDTVTYDANTPSYASSGGGDHDLVAVTRVTTTEPNGVDTKTIRDVTVRDPVGRVVFRERRLKTSGGYVQLDWAKHRYNARGQLVETIRSNGLVVEREQDCCNLTSVTDEHGTQTDTEHDALGRTVTSIKRGVAASGSYAAQADITTTIDHTTASSPNRRVITTTISGGDPNEELTERTEYDLLGRVVLRRDSAGIDTTLQYVMLGGGGRTETQSQPGDANDITTITTYFADGRAKSVTGTGVIERHYDYGVDPNTGWTWTQEWEGGVSSPRWTKTFYDEHGRTVETRRPAFDSASPLVTANEYDSYGRLVVTRVTHDGNDLFAPTVIEYDNATGAAFRRGVDLDDNGSLGVSSSEPITESDTAYESYDGGWWQRSRTWAYDEAGTSSKVVTSDVWTRVSGFAASEIAESRSVNPFGAASVSLVTLDRAAALMTETGSPPTGNGSRLAERVTRNGLLQSAQDVASNNPVTYGYDSLGRQVVTSHPRTGDLTTVYDSAGRATQTFSEDNDTTSYAYNPTTGRLDAVTDPLGHATRYAYNDRGDVTAVWGAAAQPVTFQYDVYGQRISMTTYRADDPNAWDNSTFPNPTPITGDTTEWDFDAATGLLEQKVYADSEGPIYTYTPDGRIKTRAWARYLDPNTMTPVTTTYEYNGPGGRLSGIDYNDPNTPDIAYTYTRFGGLDEVTDAVGTRTFAYDDALSVTTETFDANSIYGAKVLTTDQTDTVASKTVSRLTSVQFGTSGTPNADYEATYSYDPNSGQMTTVMGPGLPNGGATHIWEPNSPGLLQRIEFKQNSTTVASRRYEYLDHRDLLKSLTNEWDAGPTTISKYTYAYDAGSRRTSVVRTGTAFSYTNGPGSHLDLWGYNARNELTSVDRHAGTDPNSPGTANNRLDRHYSYDLIGNRISAQNGDLADPNHPGVLYEYVNNQLNQIHRINAGASAAQGMKWDADGNLHKRYLAADINQDGTVGLADLAGFNAANGTCDGDPYWNPDADIDGDGCVDLSDRAGLLALYGQPSQAIEQRWNAENRLVYWGPILPVDGDTRVHFAYDHVGRRVSQAVDTYDEGNDVWNPTSGERYVWTDWRTILELDTLNSNETLRRYTWGPDLSGTLDGAGGIQGLLAVDETQGTGTTADDEHYLFNYDGHGNVCQLIEVTDPNAGSYGSIAGRYEYDVYGNITGPDIDGDGEWEDDAPSLGGYALSCRYRFSTKQESRAYNLVYFGQRYLDSTLGAWASRDLLEESGGLRLHGLARNAPTNWVDPVGLLPCYYCGPDITDWLEVELQIVEFWAYDAVREINRAWPVGLDVYWVGGRFSARVNIMLQVGPQLTYFPTTTFSTGDCPRGDHCRNTITLCGKCVHTSEIGNLVYGYMTRKLGFTSLVSGIGARIGNRGALTPQDRAAIRAGWELDRRSICKTIGGFPDISRGASPFCCPCNSAVRKYANHIHLPPVKRGNVWSATPMIPLTPLGPVFIPRWVD